MKDFGAVGTVVNGNEGEGIVHMCHCNNCGAEIEYRVPVGGDEDEAED